jgi:Asp-tRNA(Asn)/Glu-tRNA(Gln) amidotransferase A subunit family amidase
VDPEAVAAVRATAEALRALGHAVVDAQPDLLPLERSFLTITTVGIGTHPLTEDQLDKLEPRTRLIVEAARTVPAVDYVRAQQDMHRHCRTMLAFFEDHDVLLTPTISRPAPVIGTIGADIERAWDDYRNWLCWTWPFNVTGQPAASVPAGFTRDGIPLGVQVVGSPAEERTVLSLSAQLERARPWSQHHPPGW